MSELRGTGFYRVVTPEQFRRGYFELRGCIAYHREYRCIRRTKEGNYIVMDEEARARAVVSASEEGGSES